MTKMYITERPVLRSKEESENIRLINSIQDTIIYLQKRLKKVDYYVDKYFSNNEKNQQETRIWRII